ncbi:hypothetical protein GCM10022215_11650 [Nocardioides fonticola]|uniref:P/Homo B domain-containing protein n=1 Tax=Nocardioides fonticola TaxID=450363 RepID=A0ABP7XG82_9ACTN
MTSPSRRAGRRPLRAALSAVAVVSVAVAGLSASFVAADAVSPTGPAFFPTAPSGPSSPSSSAASTTTTYSAAIQSGSPVNLPDNSDTATGVPINVTSAQSLTDITATVSLAHGCIKDLTATVVAPSNQAFAVLFNAGDGPCDDSEGHTYSFTSIGAGPPDTLKEATAKGQTGISTFKPATNMNDAFGSLSSAIGTWYIYVRDTVPGNTGGVTAASLTFDNPTSTPPSVTITSGPDDETVDVPTFYFSSSSSNVDHFECQLIDDYATRSSSTTLNGEYAPCTSPVTLYLDNGDYRFSVRAVDSDGNYQNTDYRYFSVERSASEPDAGGPSVTITSGPAEGSTVTGDVTFGFTTPADDFAGYECTVDGAFVASCTNPYTITGLAPGEHSFGVRGYDTDGNRGALTVRTFTIATPGPTQACTDAQTAYDTAVAQVTSLQKQIKDAKAAGQKKKVKKLKAKLAQAKADRDAAAAALEDC